MELIKTGEPINGRQYYTEINLNDRKKYTFSIDATKIDKFEKSDEQYNQIMNKDFNNIKTKNKIKIAGYIGAIIGSTVPLVLSLKYIKGVKRYIIGGVSAILGGLTGLAGAGILAASKFFLNTFNKTGLDKIYNECDMRLEKEEKLTLEEIKNYQTNHLSE